MILVLGRDGNRTEPEPNAPNSNRFSLERTERTEIVWLTELNPYYGFGLEFGPYSHT